MKKLRETLLSTEPNKVIGTLFLLLFIAFCMFVTIKVFESKLGVPCEQTEVK